MARGLAVGAVAFVCALFATSAAACPGTGGRGTIVAIHGGGFVIPPCAATFRRLCNRLGGRGFRVVFARYPPADYQAATRTIRRQVRRITARTRRPVYAFGESAGGNFAAMLALRGEVDAAVAVATPSNLLRWEDGNTDFWDRIMRMDFTSRRAASPALIARRSVRPVLLLHSPGDTVVPYSQSQAFARRPHIRLQRLRGDHLRDSSDGPRATRWFARLSRVRKR